MIELKKISDVFDVGSSKRVFKSEWTSEGVPFYRAREVVKLSKNGYVDNELFISEEMFQEYSKKYGVPKSGDILVTGVGTLGICYQVKDHDRFYFKDGNIVWLKKRENVSSDYIEYCFKSPFVKRQIQSTADAAVVGTYTITNARDTKIPLPPIDQQKKIAAILDAADAYRQKTKALIEKYDELTQSLFLDMFGELEGDKVSLSSICEVNPKKAQISSLDRSLKVSFVPMANVSEEGELSLVEERTIDEVWSGFTYFQEDDVVFAKITPCMENGKGAIMRGLKNKIGFGTTEFHVLRPTNDVSCSEYLFYLTHSSHFRVLAELNMKGSAGQKRVPKDFFDRYKVVAPSIALQNQFAERVQAIEAQKAQAQASLAQAEDLFNSLLQRAFKGELS